MPAAAAAAAASVAVLCMPASSGHCLLTPPLLPQAAKLEKQLAELQGDHQRLQEAHDKVRRLRCCASCSGAVGATGPVLRPGCHRCMLCSRSQAADELP